MFTKHHALIPLSSAAAGLACSLFTLAAGAASPPPGALPQNHMIVSTFTDAGCPPSGGGEPFNIGPEPRSELLKNAPYSGVGTTEVVTLLADGNRIVRTNTMRYARDSKGRTRTEYLLAAIGPFTPDQAQSIVTITDPVAGQRYVLHSALKRATVMKLYEPGTPPGANTMFFRSGVGAGGMTVAGGGMVTSVAVAGSSESASGESGVTLSGTEPPMQASSATSVTPGESAVPPARARSATNAVPATTAGPATSTTPASGAVPATKAVPSTAAVPASSAVRAAAAVPATSAAPAAGSVTTTPAMPPLPPMPPPPPGALAIAPPVFVTSGSIEAPQPNATFMFRAMPFAPGMAGCRPNARPLPEPRSLGERKIQGLKTTGSLREYTIAAGSIGNELPIVVRTEQWFSPELGVVLSSTHRDPMIGDTTYKLEQLNRAEPDASLFTVPADYTKDELPPLPPMPLQLNPGGPQFNQNGPHSQSRGSPSGPRPAPTNEPPPG